MNPSPPCSDQRLRRRGVWRVAWVSLLASNLVSASTLCAQTSAPSASLPELQQRLTEHVTQPRFAAATFGVKVVSLDTGKTLFAHDAEKLFSPASNCKLFTMALALDRLGGDYRIPTSLYATARPDHRGKLKSDLIVYGRGDPTFNARLNGGDIYRALQPLVAALTNAGIRRITGDLVGDESFLRGPPYGSGWAWDDLNYYYGAEISALSINDNTLRVVVSPGPSNGAPCQLQLSPATRYVVLSNRTQTVTNGRRDLTFFRPIEQNVVYVTGQLPLGSTNYSDDITIHNPAGLFVRFLKEALERNGVKVEGKTRTINWLDRQTRPLNTNQLIELGAITSLPLRDLVREVQKPSQNLYTDLVLAHIGSLQGGTPTQTSEDLGIRELQKFLAKAGVRRGDVSFEEGSGLSRNNLATPNATVALLQFMSRHPEAAAYRDALPIAGVDGTLRNRMKNTPAAGNVRAKTGTLRWANSLSGYVTTATGERLAFCAMLNRYAPPDAEPGARTELDKIAVLLAEFAGRTEP